MPETERLGTDGLPYPPIVARCDRCGRGYVYLQGETAPCAVNWPDHCGGTVRRLGRPEPNDGSRERLTAEGGRHGPDPDA